MTQGSLRSPLNQEYNLNDMAKEEKREFDEIRKSTGVKSGMHKESNVELRNIQKYFFLNNVIKRKQPENRFSCHEKYGRTSNNRGTSIQPEPTRVM
jgi:hypothetical protein